MSLTEDAIRQIFEHAVRTYPDECFGVVTGKGPEQTVHKCENIQNKIREKDPGRYTDSRTGYFVDRKKFDTIISAAERRGEKVVALYHSHPDIEAYFSSTDIEAQTVFGEPEFPEALQIVVSVMNGKIHDMKRFKWDRDKRCFITLKS